MDVDDGRAWELLVLGDGPGAWEVASAATGLGLRAGVVAPAAGPLVADSRAGWPWPLAEARTPPSDQPALQRRAPETVPPLLSAQPQLAGDGRVMLRAHGAVQSLRPAHLVLAPRAFVPRPSWWRGPFQPPAAPTPGPAGAQGGARVLVLGGGATGVESAAAWAAAGCDVALVEAGERLLPDWDAELAARAARDLRERGVDVRCGWRAVAVEVGTAGARVRLRRAGAAERQEAADVLVPAFGWRPALNGFGLERTRVGLDRHGRAQTDARLATAEPGLFALGAAVALPLTRATVSRQAALVAAAARGDRPPPLRHGRSARAVHGVGPLLQGGLTAAEARSRGHRVTAERVGDELAWVRCVRDAETGDLLGVQAAAPGCDRWSDLAETLLAQTPAVSTEASAPARPEAPTPLPPLLAAALAAAPRAAASAVTGRQCDG